MVPVKLHNIGAVRNAGAKQASGEVLIFLDADTRLPSHTLRAALAAIARGDVGGGAAVDWDRRPPLISAISAKLFVFCWQRLAKLAAGCFIYCRRDAFEAIGGFDPQWFAAEERGLSIALREYGREHSLGWSILRESVVSSARKMRMYSTLDMVRLFWRTVIARGGLLTGGDVLKKPKELGYFYDARREPADASK